MNKRNLAILLGLASAGFLVAAIFAINNVSTSEALPLSYQAMIQKVDSLPEVKAFLKMYPNAEMEYGDNTTDNRIGFVNYNVGGETRQSLLEIEATVNRTSGEVMNTRLECFASDYVQLDTVRDTQVSFRRTSADTDLVAFVEQAKLGLCGFPSGFNESK